MLKIDFFHIGPQKSGTTWVYQCLKEHPGVFAPDSDSIHFYDMFFARGHDWYANFFKGASDSQVLFDPTYTYIRSPWAARRIAKDNPEAKIALCLRNPVERAFSHYWHERKKNKYNFDFREVLQNYDLFSSWIEPGFYAEHIERFLQYFPRDQILVQRFELLSDAPTQFLSDLLDFIGVDSCFRPTVLKVKVNAAGHRDLPEKFLGAKILDVILKPFTGATFDRGQSGLIEYLDGPPEDLVRLLQDICRPEIERLEKLLEIGLNEWK